MEKADMDLFKFLGDNRSLLQVHEKIKICLDVNFILNSKITYPVYFLHANKLMHRDLKPENYLKVGNTFKLIDFGFVRKALNDRIMTIGVGTTLFCAPEMIENQ